MTSTTASLIVEGPAVTRRAPWPIVLLGGLVGGLAWGVNARVWMRYISTDPEFSWSGTLFIVIGFGVAGLAQSGAYLGRRRGLTRRPLTVVRVLTTAALLPLGMAAGGPLLPTILLAPLAISHTGWSRGARVAVATFAALPLLATAAGLFGELAVLRAAIGSIWLVIIYSGIVWAARCSLAPQQDGWEAPELLRAVGLLLGTFLSLMFAAAVLGG